ncbi:hypothetical protein [Rhodopirellula bahusiensis]|uniref:hypothetical protein n=1 Tax=Rhodopirellula bahusiensis TaxID=2014065 RepID=UPI003264C84B
MAFQADAATTASDALDRVDQSAYDLIIIDWHLPNTTTSRLLKKSGGLLSYRDHYFQGAI